MARASDQKADDDRPRSFWAQIDWPGAVAFMLAFGVSAALIIGMIGATLNVGPLGEKTASLLSTLGGAAVGAVATYLGLGRREQRERDRHYGRRPSDHPDDPSAPPANLPTEGEP
jgi:hypothetical protein